MTQRSKLSVVIVRQKFKNEFQIRGVKRKHTTKQYMTFNYFPDIERLCMGRKEYYTYVSSLKYLVPRVQELPDIISNGPLADQVIL